MKPGTLAGDVEVEVAVEVAVAVEVEVAPEHEVHPGHDHPPGLLCHGGLLQHIVHQGLGRRWRGEERAGEEVVGPPGGRGGRGRERWGHLEGGSLEVQHIWRLGVDWRPLVSALEQVSEVGEGGAMRGRRRTDRFRLNQTMGTGEGEPPSVAIGTRQCLVKTR